MQSEDGHIGITHGQYSVAQFFPDGTNEYVRRFVGAEESVKTAKDFSERPAAKIGIIARIVITDGGDFTVFEWQFGKGVTYPHFDKATGQFVGDEHASQSA